MTEVQAKMQQQPARLESEASKPKKARDDTRKKRHWFNTGWRWTMTKVQRARIVLAKNTIQ
jgi:hypothetical protein